MKRHELEHIIRASSAIVDEPEIIVIGSQSILGPLPDAPQILRKSMKADVYPRFSPAKTEIIEGAIGENSIFHETFGYFAHGVGEDTATLPDGWEERLVKIQNANTNGATGWCLDLHDLAVSKLAAGRPHDLDFARHMLAHQLLDSPLLINRLRSTGRSKDLDYSLEILKRLCKETGVNFPKNSG